MKSSLDKMARRWKKVKLFHIYDYLISSEGMYFFSTLNPDVFMETLAKKIEYTVIDSFNGRASKLNFHLYFGKTMLHNVKPTDFISFFLQKLNESYMEAINQKLENSLIEEKSHQNIEVKDHGVRRSSFSSVNILLQPFCQKVSRGSISGLVLMKVLS